MTITVRQNNTLNPLLPPVQPHAPAVHGPSEQGVVDLQKALNATGIQPPLAEDGVAGPKTRDAIQRFQAANGLQVDGIAGPQTLAALQNGGGSVESPEQAQRRKGGASSVGNDVVPRAPAAGAPQPEGAVNAGAFTRSVEENRRAAATAAKQPAPTDEHTLAANAQPLKVRDFSGGGNVQATRDEQGKPGAVSFTAKMAIDSDGASNVTNNRATAQANGMRYDPDYQKATSLKFKGGQNADANTLPFAVLPPDLAKASGAKPGDLMQVSYKGKTSYAIFADVGPKSKLGEGSMALARNLGINDDPRKGGVDSGVNYTVLPGSGKQFGITPGGPAPTAADIQQKGAQAFEQARQRGLVQGGTPSATPPPVATTPATTPATDPPARGNLHVNTPWVSQFDSARVPDAGKSACFRAARVMANQAGGNVPAGTGNRIQVATGENRHGQITVDPTKARQGTDYIDQQLAAGRPVVVGVSHKDARYNADGITDHFVTVTGRGTDAQGRPYYTFNDPATQNRAVGADTHPHNRFYVGADGKLSRDGAIASGYVVDRHYEVSMVVRNQ